MTSLEDKGLQFIGSLPMNIKAIPAIPAEIELMLLNQGNEQVLRSVLMLEEKSDLDDDDPVMLELRRQDMKLNLMLDMISTLLVNINAIPSSKELKLTGSDLYIKEETPDVTGFCEVNIYIEPVIPRPLKLFGVASHDPSQGHTHILFQGMSRGLTDNLDKYIFRFHRRMVANSKANADEKTES